MEPRLARTKSSKLKRMESRKSHSWWWDSHNSPKNSKWMQENLEEMDQLVNKMLKLIEEDADSFAKKAELYFKKRPELVSIVEEFYRMYRSLAERYDLVTGELRKNTSSNKHLLKNIPSDIPLHRKVSSDIQSQGSGITDVGSEPPSEIPFPDQKATRTKSGHRAAGFEFFLGSVDSSSDVNEKGDDEGTFSNGGSNMESDDSSVNSNSSSESDGDDEEQRLQERIIELETELEEVKTKLLIMSDGSKESDFENVDVSVKIAVYEEELRVAREKILLSEEEVARLTVELQKYEHEANGHTESIDLSTDEELKIVRERLHESEMEIENLRLELGLKTSSIMTLQDQLKSAERDAIIDEELKIVRERLHESEMEIENLRLELGLKTSSIVTLQDQLKSAERDAIINCARRDQEIKGLKETISNMNEDLRCQSLEEEVTRLKADKESTVEHLKIEVSLRESRMEELNRMLDELKTKHEAVVKGLKETISNMNKDLRCQSLEEEVSRLKADKESAVEHLKIEVSLRESRVEELNGMLDELKTKHEAVVRSKDVQIGQMGKHLQELHLQHAALITGAEKARKRADELRERVQELEKTIVEREEGKREAIRQLCFSLEHYQSGYNKLRQAVISVQRRPTVAAAS